jgi:hypothetical protein
VNSLEKQLRDLQSGVTFDPKKVKAEQTDKSIETIRELLQNTRFDTNTDKTKVFTSPPMNPPPPPPPNVPTFDKNIIVTSGKLILDQIPLDLESSIFRRPEIDKWLIEINKLKTGDRKTKDRKRKFGDHRIHIAELPSKEQLEAMIDKTRQKLSKHQDPRKPNGRSIIVLSHEESRTASEDTSREFLKNNRNFNEENRGIYDEQEVIEMLEKISEIPE